VPRLIISSRIKCLSELDLAGTPKELYDDKLCRERYKAFYYRATCTTCRCERPRSGSWEVEGQRRLRMDILSGIQGQSTSLAARGGQSSRKWGSGVGPISWKVSAIRRAVLTPKFVGWSRFVLVTVWRTFRHRSCCALVLITENKMNWHSNRPTFVVYVA